MIRLRIVAATICLAVTGLVASTVAFENRIIEQEQARALENKNLFLARAFAEHTLATIRLVDSALLTIADGWTDDLADTERDVARISRNLADLSFQVAITDRNGLMRFSSLGMPAKPVDLSDREHIRVHFGTVDNRLFISAPVKGRVSGKWSIQFTRPVMRNGLLKGVVVISVDPNYFAKFYESLNLGERDVVTMLRDSGQILARFPDGEKFLGQKVTGAPYLMPGSPVAGTYLRQSQIDGIERIFGWHKLPQYGLALVAGSGTGVLPADLKARRLALMLGGGSVCVAVAALAFLIVRHLESRDQRASELVRMTKMLEDRVSERTAELSRSLKDGVAVSLLMNKILSTSPSVLFIRELHSGRITYISPNVTQMLGWGVEDVLASEAFVNERIHPDDVGKRATDTDAFLGKPSIVRRFRLSQADGRFVWVHEEMNLLRNSKGDAVEIVGSWSVVDEQVRMEEQLRHSQKLEAVGQLTGGLAHDFNNLLGVVVGKLDQVDEELADDNSRLKANLDVARKAALQGAEVTRSLLAIARRQPLEIRNHDINVLLEEMMPLVRASVGSSVTVRTEYQSGALKAPIDAGGLSNAVLNLVLNARDAMSRLGAERVLSLRTRKESIEAESAGDLAPGDYAVLEVTDNGSGMSPAVLDQAFDPFFTTKQRGKGTGLGLSMVRGYTEQLGGTTRIESEAGRGTSVRLYLPMAHDGPQELWLVEAARLESLRAHHVLDTASESEFDAIVNEAARVCACPIAVVSLVDEHRQWFKARTGLAAQQTPREHAFCAHAILHPDEPMVVPDAAADSRFQSNPLVVDEPFIRFYAGVPLRDADGLALGTLCVIDKVPRELGSEQFGQLTQLASRAESLLRKRRVPSVDRSRGTVDAGDAGRTGVVGGGQPKRLRVLVVDDEQGLCEIAVAWLESMGWEAKWVMSASEALDCLGRERFDVLFTDVVMPGAMDGVELGRLAIERTPGLKVLLASGYARSLIESQSLPGPLLNKPYRRKDLVAAFTALAARAQ